MGVEWADDAQVPWSPDIAYRLCRDQWATKMGPPCGGPQTDRNLKTSATAIWGSEGADDHQCFGWEPHSVFYLGITAFQRILKQRFESQRPEFDRHLQRSQGCEFLLAWCQT